MREKEPGFAPGFYRIPKAAYKGKTLILRLL